MVIRELQKSDIRSCVAICDLNYDNKYHTQINKELHRMFDKTFFVKPTYYVAEKEGKVIAFAGYSPCGFDYNIYGLFWVNTHPEHRGSRIGYKVVKHIVHSVIKRKLIDTNRPGCVMLTCLKPLEKYYAKLAFKTVETTGNELIMCLRLNQPDAIPPVQKQRFTIPGDSIPPGHGKRKRGNEPPHYPLFKFDTHEGQCFYCEAELFTKNRTRDHVYPKRLGGRRIEGNWVYACERCNHLKDDLVLTSFAELLARLLIEARTKPDLIGTGASAYYQRISDKVKFMISKLHPDAEVQN
jgi:5-methylcytosine-specific restriction endonuclease McrA